LIFEATKWELIEASLISVGDAGAEVREFAQDRAFEPATKPLAATLARMQVRHFICTGVLDRHVVTPRSIFGDADVVQARLDDIRARMLARQRMIERDDHDNGLRRVHLPRDLIFYGPAEL
jgi:hypothetical protein